MGRRILLMGLPAAVFAPLSVRAQTAGRVYRLGFLSPIPGPPLSDALIAALNDRGWGSRNLAIEFRYTQGDPERAESLARELVKERVDAIVTVVTTTAMAARRATNVVPIVMYISGYPVEGGLADSLARPGGNVTGMTAYAGGGVLFGKFIQLLRELQPSLRELGVFWGNAPPVYRQEQVAPATDELRQAANALNVKVHFWQTGTESDVDAALSAAAAAPLDALFVTAGVIHQFPEIADRIARFTHERRLRSRVLEGTRPGDLPIEQPTKYEFVVNLKNAKAIVLNVPPALLLRADRVIQE